MTRLLRGRLAAATTGAVACLAAYLLIALLMPDVRRGLENRAADLMLALAAPSPPPSPPVVVVDIDAATLDTYGPWPWRRARVAGLVARAAESSAAGAFPPP